MASRSIKNRPGIKKKHPLTGLLVVVTVLAAVVIAGGAGLYALGQSWLTDLPDYDNIDAFNTSMPTEVYAADKTTQLAKFQLENREPVSLDQISPYVAKGTVATEDERFYDHGGFDLYGIVRAAFVTLTGAGREGASTITQQLVRNTILSKEMDDISLKRKVREMYLAVKVEERYSKDQILQMYLNTINYGNGAYGIQAASQRYFSKNASDLTLAEAATLIGIPQSPSYNEPVNHAENSLARRNLVLDRMLSNKCISQEEHDAAQAEPIALNQTVPSNDGILAYPYFTSYVRHLLTDPDGPYKYSTNEVFKGGLKVITTLDVSTQEAAEEAVQKKEDALNPSISGSLVALDPQTGQVKALVGGKDYAESQTNLATGQGTDPKNPGRPSGSSFKLFTLITALEAGISPQTMVDCSSPATIPNTDYKGANALHNINNNNYGTISMQRAFAKSSNTGFVRLEMSVGIDKVAQTAKRMGITSPLAENPSLTLGQSNVTMIDMARAYAAVANGGTLYDAQPVLQIYDSSGTLIVDNSDPNGGLSATKSKRVISKEVAHAASEVMKTVVNSYDGTGTDAALPNGQPVAAKTGTSSNYLDITFCGVTPQMSVAIWFGDPSNQVQLPPSVGAGDVFRNFLTPVLADQPVQDFQKAGDPSYKPFSNSTYHIGSAGAQNDSKKDFSDAKKDDEDKADKGSGDEGEGNGAPSVTPAPAPPAPAPTPPQPPPTPKPPDPSPGPAPDNPNPPHTG